MSLIVALISIPHIFLASVHDKALFYDALLETVIFLFVGPVVGALRDRDRRQAALNQRLQSLAAIGETISTVAHEMKNILIPMQGFLRRLHDKKTFNEKGSLYFEIVEKEADKLNKMVKDMLAFGRNVPLQKDEVEIGSLMEDIRQILDDEFHHNGIKLICRCDDGEKRVELDRDKVHNALVNLLQNALHASARGKDVRFLVEHDNYFVRIIIEDEGTGIPKEHMDQIFKPFFTTKPQGTGLGLAITYQIVKEHRGNIRVESDPGNGTRFTLTLPLSG